MDDIKKTKRFAWTDHDVGEVQAGRVASDRGHPGTTTKLQKLQTKRVHCDE